MRLHSSLYDIEELLLKCNNEEAKDYISEAIICYKNGAYRSSIVSIWIALVFDIINKIYELSYSDVTEAKKIIQDFESAQANLHDTGKKAYILDFEKNILGHAKTLQLIDAYQHQDLERLYEDRNRCAHPSFNKEKEAYQPSSEQVRVHLRNAIEYVLSQRAIQGRLAISLFERYFYSNHLIFPEYDKLKRQFISLGFNKLPRRTAISIIDDIIFKKLEPSNIKNNGEYYDISIWILKLFSEFSEENVLSKLGKNLIKILEASSNDEKTLAYSIAVNFENLIDFSSEKMTVFKDEIINIIEGKYKFENERLYFACIKSNYFSDFLLNKVSGYAKEDLCKAIILFERARVIKGDTAKFIINSALDIYSKVASFDSANYVADNIIHRLINYFDKEDVNNLLEIIDDTGSDQIWGSYSLPNTLTILRDKELLFPQDLNNRANLERLCKYHEIFEP